MKLKVALHNLLWQTHKLGDTYHMDGKPAVWKIEYYPLFGTYKNHEWFDFKEPRALIEKPMQPTGTDFREVPLRYLTKIGD